MSNELSSIFAMIGLLVCVGIGLGLLYLAFDALRDLIDRLRWEYRYKHRFDKPPTAKCYCKDCKWHDETNQCLDVTWADRYTPDNGFCYDAEPRKEDVDDE